MNNDTIKLLNLEDVNIDLNKSHVDKVNGNLVVTIVLNNDTKCCKFCGSTSFCSHGFIHKKITHSISTNQACILNYKARRFKCKDCVKTFLEYNPFCQEDKKGNFIIIKKRLSNGPMEGCNSRIKCLIKNANGYRNFERFRKRVFFSLNKNTPIKVKKNKLNRILELTKPTSFEVGLSIGF